MPARNPELDRGRSWADAMAERFAVFPQNAALIRAFDERWTEMVPGKVPGSVASLEALRVVDALLNAVIDCSAEKLVVARGRFAFLNGYRDVVVSG